MEIFIWEEPKGGNVQVIRAGVLGSPISHSLSPLLHQTAYEFLGVQATYEAFDVASGGLKRFLDNGGAALNCLSLTMPLKEEAMEIADSISDISRQISSGNTLHKVAGGWALTSTDVEGFAHALQAHGKEKFENALILGAGATARAIAAACSGVASTLTVLSRNTAREESLQRSIPELSVDFLPWDGDIDFGSYDLVINTTPAEAASIFVGKVHEVNGTFFEVLYNPWPSALLARWRGAGGYGIDGLDLLIHQAISQVELFSSLSVDRVNMAGLLRSVGVKALQ